MAMSLCQLNETQLKNDGAWIDSLDFKVFLQVEKHANLEFKALLLSLPRRITNSDEGTRNAR